MFDRFTDRARKVMSFSRQEAERYNHDYIGTEHVLLGLVREGSGVAANVLKNLDVDLNKVRAEIEKIVKPAPDVVTMGQLPFTPRAKKVLEFAIDEARALDHNYVGTEHLLLGLLREQEGIAPQVLMNLGVRVEDVRTEVEEFLTSDNSHTKERNRWSWWDSFLATMRAILRQPPRKAGTAPPDDDSIFVFADAARLAKKRNDSHVGTEHLLIAMCERKQPERLQADWAAVIQKTHDSISTNPPAKIMVVAPFSSGVLHVIALAMKEAESRGKAQFDCGDLIIAMIREQDGVAAKVLASFGITEEVARAKLAKL